ncbi:outer membrane beta-barrel protein [Silvibacterium dinghuense]|uniref:Outer membrane protein beta-barrel domain-containing protein n=1 Tax=Silvibacterium dinghuense TaxID=1560006 RepID=A0A4Q1SEX3_9BACT|nr:outer membrane beta-barrel protein [Silvibacterium dinghuense]RXS95621.1 hypothetical protein ESZ00_13745 [Silvibacterium dinghuense]GGH14472.1 hypothetical protein GCM10011586_34920 [Silvibacterium dinghuense]
MKRFVLFSVLGTVLTLVPALRAEEPLPDYTPTSPIKNPLSNHRWEVYGGIAYKPFQAGPGDGHTSTMWGFNGEAARFFNEHWAIAATGRGVYGTAHPDPNSYGFTKPPVTEYMYMGGPEYRYARNEHLNLSLHAFFGAGYNQINGSLRLKSGEYIDPELVGLYKDEPAFVSSFGGAADFAVTNHWAIRLEPEAVLDDFTHSDNTGGMAVHFGASAGVVYRFHTITRKRASY